MDEQARRATPPKRVRHPAGCSFASGCSPPRLATTQLPSATCVTTSHRSDFHLPDKTTSRTHSPAGLTRGSMDRRVKPGDDGSGWVNLIGTRARAAEHGSRYVLLSHVEIVCAGQDVPAGIDAVANAPFDLRWRHRLVRISGDEPILHAGSSPGSAGGSDRLTLPVGDRVSAGQFGRGRCRR